MKTTQRHNWRCGMALIAALVALAVTSAVFAGILAGAATLRRQVRTHREQAQVRYLVDAGIQRAIARLRDSSSYRGETWLVPADQLGGSSPAEVVIQLSERENDPEKIEIAVRAEYPQNEFRRVRESRTVTVSFID
jgi:type II secretory pathway component PulK